MKKNFIALVGAGLMILSLAACSSSKVSTNTPSASSPSSSASPDMMPAANGDAIVGQVTAISGDTITLAIGTQNMPQGGGPGGNSGNTAPDSSAAPDDSNPVPSGDTIGGPAPSGDMPVPSGDGQQPEVSGQMPQGGQLQDGQQPGGMPGFTLTGETKTITLTSDTVITVSSKGESTTGTIADIAVGDILSVTMDGDTVTAVTVGAFFSGGFDGKNGNTDTSGTAASTAPADSTGSN